MGSHFTHKETRQRTGLAGIHSLKGFTLIEILTVLAVMTIMLTLAVPATQSVIQSYLLREACLMVQNTFGEARQTSFSLNRPVQIRLCRATSDNASYQTIQIFVVDPDPRVKPVAVGRPKAFPQGVCIASDPTLTSLMTLGELVASDNDPAIGAMNTQYSYRKFNIYPTGITDLSPGEKWFLTVVNDRNNIIGSTPANFATIQINPVNGLSAIFYK